MRAIFIETAAKLLGMFNITIYIYILHVFLHPISCFGLEKNIVIMFVKIFCNSFDVTNFGRTFMEKVFAKMHKVLFGILHLFLLP